MLQPYINRNLLVLFAGLKSGILKKKSPALTGPFRGGYKRVFSLGKNHAHKVRPLLSEKFTIGDTFNHLNIYCRDNEFFCIASVYSRTSVYSRVSKYSIASASPEPLNAPPMSEATPLA